MKKLLALLFVCAGLTAMAGTPRVIDGKQFNHNAKGSMVMKANKFANNLTMPGKTIQQFGREMKAEGKLINKAPFRLTDKNSLIGTYIFFGDEHAWSQDQTTYDIVVDTVPYMSGGWDVTFSENSNDNFLSFSGLYQGYEAADTVIIYPDDDAFLIPNWTSAGKETYKGKTSGSTRKDTTYEYFLVSEPYLLGTENKHIQGTVDENGWLVFDDGMFVYTERVIQTVNNYTQAVTKSDTAAYLNVYEDIVLVPPTGKHEYALEGTGGAVQSNNVFMYQANDTTVSAWNLWGAGNYGSVLYIYNDGTMTLPSWQAMMELSPAALKYYAQTYSQYDWTNSQTLYNLGVNYDYDADEATSFSGADVTGAVTAQAITWDGSALCNFLDQGTDKEGIGFADVYINNKLYYTDGETFMTEKTIAPVFAEPVESAEAITFSATSEEAGAEVYMFIVDTENQTTTQVTNPYAAERGDEDYTITLAAYAVVDGKLASDVVTLQYVVPAVEQDILVGDVNGDGEVDVADVATLIGYVLGDQPEMFIIENANVDGSEGIDVGDVAALIQLILG